MIDKLTAGEQEEFEKVVTDAKCNPDDFEVRVEDITEHARPSLSIIKRMVTVKNVKNGKEKTYQAGGHGTAWGEDFKKDIKESYFS